MARHIPFRSRWPLPNRAGAGTPRAPLARSSRASTSCVRRARHGTARFLRARDLSFQGPCRRALSARRCRRGRADGARRSRQRDSERAPAGTEREGRSSLTTTSNRMCARHMAVAARARLRARPARATARSRGRGSHCSCSAPPAARRNGANNAASRMVNPANGRDAATPANRDTRRWETERGGGGRS